MFSIENIRKKVNDSKVKYSFFKFLFEGTSSLSDVFLLLLATAFFCVPGCGLALVLSDFFLKENTAWIFLGCMILSSLTIWGLIYRVDKKDYKKCQYNVSQEDIREYIKSLETVMLKEHAINSIAEAAQKNKGNINFKHLESIYNRMKEIKQKENEEKEIKSAEEATKCLVKSLREELIIEKEVCPEKEHII